VFVYVCIYVGAAPTVYVGAAHDELLRRCLALVAARWHVVTAVSYICISCIFIHIYICCVFLRLYMCVYMWELLTMSKVIGMLPCPCGSAVTCCHCGIIYMYKLYIYIYMYKLYIFVFVYVCIHVHITCINLYMGAAHDELLPCCIAFLAAPWHIVTAVSYTCICYMFIFFGYMYIYVYIT